MRIAFSLSDQQAITNSLSALGMSMLTMAPEEVAALDISRALRLELQDQLLNALPQILLLVSRITTANESELKVVEAIKLLSSWLSQGVTLSALHEEYKCIFSSIWKGLHSGNEDSTMQCCSLLRELLSHTEFPRSTGRNVAVLEIAKMLVSSKASFAVFFTADKASESAAHEICSCIISLLCYETALLSAPDTAIVDLWHLLLSCATQRPRKLAVLTFDAWLSLQDLPVAERHPFLQMVVFHSLLDTLLLHSQYPEGFTSWDADEGDDEDDFTAFRDQRQGVQDVIVVCFYAMQRDFFNLLTERLQESNTWNRLEAVMSVLSCVMDSAKKSIAESSPGDSPVLLITEIATRVISLNTTAAPMPLFESSCRFLGSITFFLVTPVYGSLTGDLFFPALEVLFQIYASCSIANHRGGMGLGLGLGVGVVDAAESTGNIAAKSIHKLCVRGSLLFTQPGAYQKIAGLVDLTSKILTRRCDSAATESCCSTETVSSLLVVVEVAMRTITVAVVDIDSSRELTAVLGRPIILGLTGELNSLAPSKAKVELLIAAASQIVKFSDQVKVDQGQLIGEFLSALWPLLYQILCNATLRIAVGVTNQLFGFYSSSILSAKTLLLSKVLDMASTVVSYLQMFLAHSSDSAGSLSMPTPISTSSSCSASIKCAGSIVEALAGREDGAHVLSTLLERVTEAVWKALQGDVQRSTALRVAGSPHPPLLATDADVVERYFGFVYLYLLLCPEIAICLIESLRKVVYVLSSSLSLCKERGPLRAALQVLQSIFSPSTARLMQHRVMLLDIGCERGEEMVNQIVRSVCGEVQSSLVPNLIEALLCILSGCEDSAHRDRTRVWMLSALSDTSISSLHSVSPSDKHMVLSCMFRLLSSDRRRCKALLHDFSKVCFSESTPDCLLAYEE